MRLVELVFVLIAAGLAVEANSDGTIVVSSVRFTFVPPKLFDFDQFKLLFNKQYNSLVEEMNKKRIYVAKAFAAFVSSINYQAGKLSSYRSVNQMSDWTSEERYKLLVHKSPQIEVAQGQDRKLSEIQSAIDEIEQHKQEPEYKELAKEIDRLSGDKQRRKRDTFMGHKFASKLLKSLVGDKTRTVIQDDLFIDHRKSGCIGDIKQQGNCGSCASFATVALFEYLFCTQTGDRKSFSEQYLVDCMTDNNGKPFGCDGVGANLPTIFINKFGLELADRYPYKRKLGSCPIKRQQPREELGQYKPREASLIYVDKSKLVDHLGSRPIVYSIRVDDSFLDYGGGVDENSGCRIDDNHAMLLVGHGHQDGKEYLLFRNSYSRYWGQQGYYKMSLAALERCGADPMGSTSEGGFLGDGKNPNYKGFS